MTAAGLTPLTSTPERFGEFIGTEIARYAKVIKDAKLQIEQ
jgi:tripartite-type tricarboxylate transporter receptor subunit TctC